MNDNKFNGRVNILEQPNRLTLGIYDKIPSKSTSYTDAMEGVYYNTILSDTYFSSDNQEIIQNGIRNGVYNMSKGKFVVGIQDYDTLKVIMRSMFLQHSENSPKDIKGQIERLNNYVLDYSIKNVYNEAVGYLNYVKDVSTLAVPISHPIEARLFDKQLEPNAFMH